jgi:hypothetical protein
MTRPLGLIVGFAEGQNMNDVIQYVTLDPTMGSFVQRRVGKATFVFFLPLFHTCDVKCVYLCLALCSELVVCGHCDED